MRPAKQLIQQYRLPSFIVGVIVLAILMMVVSMSIYYLSGAYRLDLSRPEYTALRSQIRQDATTVEEFPAQGAVDGAVLEDFLLRYKKEADGLIELKAFSIDVLSDENLGI